MIRHTDLARMRLSLQEHAEHVIGGMIIHDALPEAQTVVLGQPAVQHDLQLAALERRHAQRGRGGDGQPDVFVLDVRHGGHRVVHGLEGQFRKPVPTDELEQKRRHVSGENSVGVAH